MADSFKLFDEVRFSKSNLIFDSALSCKYFSYGYFTQFVYDYTDILSFPINVSYVLKSKTGDLDTLQVVKDTQHEIRFYYNGNYLKTIDALDETPPKLFVYK